MDSAKIQWFVGAEGNFSVKSSHHAGTLTPNNSISIDLQIWNNRWGVADVENLINPVVTFYFDKLEDSAVLQYCQLILNNNENVSLTIAGNKAMAAIPCTLSGVANNGVATASRANYLGLQFKIVLPSESRIKHNDLKNLYFSVSPLDK